LYYDILIVNYIILTVNVFIFIIIHTKHSSFLWTDCFQYWSTEWGLPEPIQKARE